MKKTKKSVRTDFTHKNEKNKKVCMYRLYTQKNEKNKNSLYVQTLHTKNEKMKKYMKKRNFYLYMLKNVRREKTQRNTIIIRV
jgi:hypothetical protein